MEQSFLGHFIFSSAQRVFSQLWIDANKRASSMGDHSNGTPKISPSPSHSMRRRHRTWKTMLEYFTPWLTSGDISIMQRALLWADLAVFSELLVGGAVKIYSVNQVKSLEENKTKSRDYFGTEIFRQWSINQYRWDSSIKKNQLGFL